VNEQRVLNVTKNTEWIKMHVARPTVVKANGKYFMYFETPATLDNGREYDNNVLLATSTDGINFNYYPNNENPQPIIKQPASSMKKGVYGVGQPSAFYKDGTFYLYYTDAVSGDGFKVATSKDGINFGDYG
jgi:beta-xylosidase